MANYAKPSHVARQQVKTLTPEEQKEQQMRAYIQKKASLAEGILYNMVRGNVVADAKGIVKIADEMATEFMKVIYMQEVHVKEEGAE